MFIRRTQQGWIAHAPAKVNLYLEVLGKRADGYHELETVICPVSLYDTVLLRPRKDGKVTFTCRLAKGHSGRFLRTVPTGDDNLVVRAVCAFQRELGVDQGCDIVLTKRIPVQAGLGGGSADAAAALLLCRSIWQPQLSNSRLLEIAASVGSDVPGLLVGGPVLCRGRGEIVSRIHVPRSISLVIADPGVGLSTREIFSRHTCDYEPRVATNLIAALRYGNIKQLGACLFNRLEKTAIEVEPRVAALIQRLEQLGAFRARMTGSGSSVFGLCYSRRHALHIARQVASDGHITAFAVNITA